MLACPMTILAARRASRRAMSTATTEVEKQGAMDRLRAYSSKNKDTATLIGSVMGGMAAMAGGAAAIVYAANYTMGWQPKLTALETQMANLVKKEDFTKVETEVKNLATKEELAKVGTTVGKVETEVKNVLQSARLEGRSAALEAWVDKEVAIAGGKARKA